MITVELLGPFALRRADDTDVSLGLRKAQWVIAVLAIDDRVARDHLASLLWGAHSDDRARHNLRQALSAIRNACGPIVRSDGDFLALDEDHCKVDVLDFKRLATRDDEQSLERCTTMLAGELLEGAAPRDGAFEDWLRLAREQFRQAACDVMDRYVQLLFDRKDYPRSIRALQRRLAADPACEPAHRDMMIALSRTGRRSDALRQYDLCQDALQRELGVSPDPQTEALIAEIRKPGGGAAEPSPGNQPADAAETTGESVPTIAVLPFENLSGDVDAFFADGISEDITTALSHFHSLRVIARGSAFAFRDRTASDREIAQALGARFLVRGSVRRAGDRVRLSVQLLDGTAGVNLWANRFDREMTDIFVVQDEITSTLVSTLAGRVEAVQIEDARKVSARRLAAYDILLRGKDHHHRFTAEDCETCIDLFKQAIDRDPDYALAHAWLACGLGQAMVWGLDENARLVDGAQAAAERGLELDENESECHRILAQVNLTRGNLTRALKHQERALELNPNDDRSVCSMGEILVYAGRHEDAEQWVRKSMKLNPYHPQRYWTHLARALYHADRFADALDVLDQIGRPRPDDLVYAIAASARSGDEEAVRKNSDALRVAFPDCNACALIDSMPFAHAADRDAVRGALLAAGLG